MSKNVLKFSMYAFGILAVGALVTFGIDYLRYRQSPEYQTEANLKNIEKQYAEDPYGGATPEETLRLFVDALKKGDTDLAAKYFVLGEQEQWKQDLAIMKDKNLLGDMVKDLEKAKRGSDINKDASRFIVTNEQSEVITVMEISKGQNGKWKITDL